MRLNFLFLLTAAAKIRSNSIFLLAAAQSRVPAVLFRRLAAAKILSNFRVQSTASVNFRNLTSVQFPAIGFRDFAFRRVAAAKILSNFRVQSTAAVNFRNLTSVQFPAIGFRDFAFPRLAAAKIRSNSIFLLAAAQSRV